MTQNDYIELAKSSFAKLFEGVDGLADRGNPVERRKLEESLFSELRLLWTRIAWADGQLSEGEKRLFQCLIDLAQEKDLSFTPYRDPDLAELPVFLRESSASGSLISAYMISQLEVVGFALLAADGRVSMDELQQLGAYLDLRREQTEAASGRAERILQHA